MTDLPAATEQSPPPSKRDRTRLAVGTAAGAVVLVLALINLNKVRVHWLFGTWKTPLIVVIALSFLLGFVAGVVISRRRGGSGS